MAVFSSGDFSQLTRLYWLTQTKAGLATGWSALLGMVVGGVITSQSLYSATAANRREFAVLRAMGVPRWRLTASVLAQAFWVGCIGVVLAMASAFGLGWVTAAIGLPLVLPVGLLVAAATATLVMAVLSSILALRSVQRIDPAELLH
jgi:putative ABC transport system permease protein